MDKHFNYYKGTTEQIQLGSWRVVVCDVIRSMTSSVLLRHPFYCVIHLLDHHPGRNVHGHELLEEQLGGVGQLHLKIICIVLSTSTKSDPPRHQNTANKQCCKSGSNPDPDPRGQMTHKNIKKLINNFF